jgi:hypothetical protein
MKSNAFLVRIWVVYLATGHMRDDNFAIGQGAGVPTLPLVKGAGVPKLLLVRVRGVPTLLLVRERGSYFAIGHSAGSTLFLDRVCLEASLKLWVSGVYMGRCPIGQGVGVYLLLVKVQGSISHWLASRS